jgi:hypothetical protein
MTLTLNRTNHHQDAAPPNVGAFLDAAHIAIIHAVPADDQTPEQRKWLHHTISSHGDSYRRLLPGFDTFLASLTARDLHWYSQFQVWANQLPAEYRPIVVASLSLYWPIDEDFPVDEGPHQRRLDAIFDVMDVPGSGADVQALYMGAMESLAEESKNSMAAFTTDCLSVFASGTTALFTLSPELGQLAGSGVSWIGEEFNSSLGAEAADSIAFPYIIRVIADAEGLDDLVTEVDQYFRDSYVEVMADIGNRRKRQVSLDGLAGVRRMLRATLEALEISMPSDSDTVDIVGLCLSDARELLNLHGYEIESVEDVTRPQGEGRVAWREGAWLVCQQSNRGSKYIVGVRKPLETIVREI